MKFTIVFEGISRTPLGRLSLWLILFFMPLDLMSRTAIDVNNQSSFDILQQSVTNAVKSGDKDIVVKLSQGTYIAKERHLTLNGINAPDVSISIDGSDAIILPSGIEYRNGDKYRGALSVRTSWMTNSRDVNVWSRVQYAEGRVEIVNESNKLCRLKVRESASSAIHNASYILIPHWFQTSVYPIDKIEGRYIYFSANDLKKSFLLGYNVNGDYLYGSKSIRYKLFNAKDANDCLRIINGLVSLPSGLSSARECGIHRYITIQNCSFRSVEIKGIKFWGNNYAYDNPAISVNNVNCGKLSIIGCEFRGMRGDVITIVSSSNIYIEGNAFNDCYLYGVQSDNQSSNIIVKDNTFTDMGKRMHNTFCVLCHSKNFLISDNKMTDFGYGGIGVGVHYKSNMTNPCYGIVENNELSYTEGYMAEIDNYGIMDSGAIYVMTKNDGTIIRNNFIHNYSGMKDNRGIFCDDGAYNFQIYENVIIGIANSYCIDSRRVASVERKKTPESGIEKANINIVIRDNIVDGQIRFEAHEDKNNRCVKGANYVIKKNNRKIPQNTLKNVINAEIDVVLESDNSSNGKIELSSKSLKQLKKSKAWPSARKYLLK